MSENTTAAKTKKQESTWPRYDTWGLDAPQHDWQGEQAQRLDRADELRRLEDGAFEERRNAMQQRREEREQRQRAREMTAPNCMSATEWSDTMARMRAAHDDSHTPRDEGLMTRVAGKQRRDDGEDDAERHRFVADLVAGGELTAADLAADPANAQWNAWCDRMISRRLRHVYEMIVHSIETCGSELGGAERAMRKEIDRSRLRVRVNILRRVQEAFTPLLAEIDTLTKETSEQRARIAVLELAVRGEAKVLPLPSRPGVARQRSEV